MLIFMGITACSNGDSTGDSGQAIIGSDKKFSWKIVSAWPANFPIFHEGLERFADDVRLMSNGRLNIQVYAGGELVPALGVFDAVSQGSVEMGFGSPYYWAGKIPAAQFFSSVPFGLTTKGMETWIYQGGGIELWRELYEPFNLTVFPMGNVGVQMGGWFNKKINSVADVKGLRMRIPGLGGKVFNKAGGNPVLMAGGEIYTALERGTIDATEWIAPFHDMKMGLDRAADYYYYPAWHEPGTVLELMINTSRWNELPDDLKKIIEVAASATNKWIYTSMEYHNQQALQEIKLKDNIEVLKFPPGLISELRTFTNEALEEESQNNVDFKRVYDAYEAFRKTYTEWSSMANDTDQDSLSFIENNTPDSG